MTVVDRRAADPKQPRHSLDHRAAVGDFDPLGANHYINLSPDQPTGNRVGVATHRDRAARSHRDADDPFVRVELAWGQRPEVLLFNGELVGSRLVAFGDHPFDELHVLLTALEIAAASQQQRLVDHELDLSVGGFDIAVFVRAARVGVFAGAAVMLHQLAITLCQPRLGRMVGDRRAEAVGAMAGRCSAELEERFLRPLAERFEGLGETERDGLDVGVGQHAVKQRVVEAGSGDGNVERVHDGEVASGDLARVMDLRKHDGFGGPGGASPVADAAFEGASLGLGKAARVLIAQPVEKGHRSQLGLRLEPAADDFPDILEGIGTGSIIAPRSSLRGHRPFAAPLARRFLVHG